MPVLENIKEFQNEWRLRLNDEVPMDLTVDMGAGSATLQLGGLSLTRARGHSRRVRRHDRPDRRLGA